MKIKKVQHIDLNKRIQKIKSINAKAGFFSSAKYEDGTSVAQVAIQNEYGVPQKKIPPRPFMRPAMNNKMKWNAIFAKASKQAFKNGNFVRPFELVGLTVQGDIKDSIKAVTKPALKESTVRARLRGKKQGKSVSLTIAKPLQDSNSMFDSVQYKVSK